MAGRTETFTIETSEPEQSFDITARVREIAARGGVAHGMCHVMALHSTMAVVVNETADPNIGRDVIRALGALVPTKNDWLHDRKDDNAHAHVKASLLGASEQIPIVDGALCSGSGRRSGSTSSTARARATIAVHLVEG
jgi:secondary thiamine-phosphate synthase enzyme